MAPIPALDELPRTELVPVALEQMLLGMIATRAMLPQVVMHGGDMDLMNQVAIDEWMGASPNYTWRMRRLMGIEGDDVNAIIKALQLDCGFVHQYMDVAYKVTDDLHAEFWLNHCGALLDAEPHGEERVFGMCHTIEDPTFDATALATNPRARIRPIHRPPRAPADRHPHCHWTLVIDPENDPVGAIPLTEEVGRLPLASVPNEVPPDREPGGMRDYTGPLRPGFRLADLSWGGLAAVAREFQVQAHLLVAATELALRTHFDVDVARRIVGDAWVGTAWLTSERMAGALRLEARDPHGLARVLSLHGALPPGFDRTVEVHGNDVHVELVPSMAGLLSRDHAGWLGLLASRETRGLEAAVFGFDRRARVHDVDVRDGRVAFRARIDGSAEPVAEPDSVALARIGMASTWHFDT
ncbi:MAG: hypothetical protein JOZ99_09730, partial [Actinobacteria bacterium]|nr:hypothetical protein [Actinomycetota bacterium]